MHAIRFSRLIFAQQGLTVVPMSLELEGDRRVMVISGPNAGGKTVVLKTVGLLALMAQSGLHTPAAEAKFPVFSDVQADIGDHGIDCRQSIDFHFGRHQEACRVEISAGLEIPAIILLDEVGAGTDPEEGSALGVGIVVSSSNTALASWSRPITAGPQGLCDKLR